MADSEKPSGCGVLVIYTAVFRRGGSFRTHRRSASTSSLPRPDPTSNADRQRAGSDETSLVLRPANPPVVGKPSSNPNSRKPARMLPGPAKPLPAPIPVPVPVPVPGNRLSCELDSVLFDYQKTKGSSTLVRASSGNVMVYGNLGNIRPNRSSAKDSRNGYGSGANRVMGNIVRSTTGTGPTGTGTGTAPQVVLCRALSKRMDPEELKEMGNGEYKKGRFAEALALYERAILLDPGKASYRSNKAAALTGLGRILEAALECNEAVRIEPAYCRAHHRLGALYFRLGEAEKAIHHYKLSRLEANPSDISRAQDLQKHHAKCNEARRLKDWQTVLKESRSAISIGADSAPQVFAWQAEALIKLNKHDEADMVLNGLCKFDIDASTNLFGATVNGYVLMIWAQVDTAAGRFEEAVAAAQRATQLDLNNPEISTMVQRTRAVASARSKGNDLFKASRFGEACIAYGEGLDHDPHNAILLCNRAASRSKLGHWEKAIDDCNAALRFRPLYSKARLRRADCNAKLGRWEASIQDYEVLIKEIPGDEEVGRALLEAKSQLKKKRGEYAKDTT